MWLTLLTALGALNLFCGVQWSHFARLPYGPAYGNGHRYASVGIHRLCLCVYDTEETVQGFDNVKVFAYSGVVPARVPTLPSAFVLPGASVNGTAMTCAPRRIDAPSAGARRFAVDAFRLRINAGTSIMWV